MVVNTALVPGDVERFAGAHPPHYRGSPSAHKAAAGHAFRSSPGSRALNPRGCFRRQEGPSKGSLALILPTIVGPLRSQGHGWPCHSISTRVQGSKSTWMFPAAGGAVERFASAHPSHYRGSPHTRPRTSMPFDRHPVPGFFAPLTSNANKCCK